MAISTIFTIHGHNETHVARVMAEMEKLGAPSVRVVHCGDYYMAIEGTHRLEAAARLGLAPELVVLEQDEDVEVSSLDIDCFDASESYTAGEIAGELYSEGCGEYRLEDDKTITLRRNGLYVPVA